MPARGAGEVEAEAFVLAGLSAPCGRAAASRRGLWEQLPSELEEVHLSCGMVGVANGVVVVVGGGAPLPPGEVSELSPLRSPADSPASSGRGS